MVADEVLLLSPLCVPSRAQVVAVLLLEKVRQSRSVASPAVDDAQVMVIVSWPDVFPFATVPIHISWRLMLAFVSLVGPATRVQVVALPPLIDETLMDEDPSTVTSTRTSPTAAVVVRVRLVRAVPVAESRLPTTVIAI
jgi:hypothetical protein